MRCLYQLFLPKDKISMELVCFTSILENLNQSLQSILDFRKIKNEHQTLLQSYRNLFIELKEQQNHFNNEVGFGFLTRPALTVNTCYSNLIKTGNTILKQYAALLALILTDDPNDKASQQKFLTSFQNNLIVLADALLIACGLDKKPYSSEYATMRDSQMTALFSLAREKFDEIQLKNKINLLIEALLNQRSGIEALQALSKAEKAQFFNSVWQQMSSSVLISKDITVDICTNYMILLRKYHDLEQLMDRVGIKSTTDAIDLKKEIKDRIALLKKFSAQWIKVETLESADLKSRCKI